MRLAKKICLALLCVMTIAVARADQLSDDLNSQYQRRVFGVRYPIHGGSQEFDSDGHPLNPGPAPAWEIYGGVLIERVRLNNDQLHIECLRVVPSDRMESGNPVVITLGSKTNFDIHLDHPLTSMDDAKTVLGRVFYLDENDAGHRKPELRRTGSSTLNPVRFDAVSKAPGFVAPKPQYTPEPEFSDAARRTRFQGTVSLSILIDAQGAVAAVRLERGLGQGLDENAMETVKNWRFSPAISNGAPVSLWMHVDVDFHFYGGPRRR
jgi:TonB family protein